MAGQKKQPARRSFDVTVGGLGSQDVQISFPDPPAGIALTATPSAVSLPQTGRKVEHVVINASATQSLTPGFRVVTPMFTFADVVTVQQTFGITVE